MLLTCRMCGEVLSGFVCSICKNDNRDYVLNMERVLHGPFRYEKKGDKNV